MCARFNQMQIASFSVQLHVFPQKLLYFHKKIALKPPCFQGNREYLSIQRRSNPPEGESRQEPRRAGSGVRKSAGKGTPKRTGNGNRKSTGDETRKGIGEEARKGIQSETHAALRRLDAADGTRKLLQRMECRGTRNASSARRSRITLRLRVVVTWAPNQVFEKSDS